MRTRIAPTPSGFLHAGNAVNFLVTSWLARAMHGTVVLRIDDMDRERYRREYVDDIFSVLEWLGIEIHEGPSSTAEFEVSYSMQQHLEQYRHRLALLRRSPTLETFVCSCSRHDLARGHVCACRDLPLELEAHRTALRVHVPASLPHLAEVMGDFVVWRRDDTAAYQLASVVEDEELAITHIVRGADLEPSTWAQRLLAPAIGASVFDRAVVLHHRLIADASGDKLSKSHRRSGPMPRTNEHRARIMRLAERIAGELDIDAP